MDSDPTWTINDEIERLCDNADSVPDSFFLERRLDRADRSVVLHNVFLDSDDRWRSAFVVMLLLAGGIASLGLSQDSAATVIGSMIIAPLGAPMIGLGAALALAWPYQAARMGAIVVAGAGAVVLAAFVMGLFLPDATPTAQILARTNPDLRDLGVAVLAGAAGAFAHTRTSLSSSLVGVSIAVALVPPLAAVGLLAEASRWGLAKGALTLFLANLVGITIAAAIVLLVTGYVPPLHLRERSAGVILGLVAASTAVVVVAIPLTIAYSSVASGARSHTDIYTQVAATTEAASNVNVTSIKRSGDEVRIKVSDPTAAPAAAEYEKALIDEVGPNVKVIVE